MIMLMNVKNIEDINEEVREGGELKGRRGEIKFV